VFFGVEGRSRRIKAFEPPFVFQLSAQARLYHRYPFDEGSLRSICRASSQRPLEIVQYWDKVEEEACVGKVYRLLLFFDGALAVILEIRRLAEVKVMLGFNLRLKFRNRRRQSGNALFVRLWNRCRLLRRCRLCNRRLRVRRGCRLVGCMAGSRFRVWILFRRRV
jgi:hypothetical protein